MDNVLTRLTSHWVEWNADNLLSAHFVLLLQLYDTALLTIIYLVA